MFKKYNIFFKNKANKEPECLRSFDVENMYFRNNKKSYELTFNLSLLQLMEYER